MKKFYQVPQMETDEYGQEDIIVTSGGSGSSGNIGDIPPSVDDGNYGQLYG